jgi:hypothetical protein
MATADLGAHTAAYFGRECVLLLIAESKVPVAAKAVYVLTHLSAVRRGLRGARWIS